MTSDRIGRIVEFATIGVLNLTQELAGAILADVDGADPDVVAEETLCLVTTATARAAEVALRGDADAATTISTLLLDLPFVYRDYLIGSEMLIRQDSTLAETGDDVYHRLQRKRSFYEAHLPVDAFPGERTLNDKMDLWMGRVSPPKIPETPTKRLQRLGLIDPLVTHLKLVLAYAKKFTA